MKQKKIIRFGDFDAPEPSAGALHRCIDRTEYHLHDQSIRSYSLKRAFCIQLRYISPLFWLLQAAAFALLIAVNSGPNPEYQIMLSAFGPVLMAISAPELAKSYTHGMWELESSAMYSLPRLTSIRLFIVGSIDILMLSAASLAFGKHIELHPIDRLFSIAVPFLLGSLTNFVILDRIPGQIGSALCAACALLIAVLSASLAESRTILPHAAQVCALMVSFALCALLAARYVQHEGSTTTNATYD